MWYMKGASRAIALGLAVCAAASASAEQRWAIDAGETSLLVSGRAMEQYGVWAEPTGEAAAGTIAESEQGERLSFLIDPSSDFIIRLTEDGAIGFEGSILHQGGVTLGGPAGQRGLETFILTTRGKGTAFAELAAVDAADENAEVFTLLKASVQLDPTAQIISITSDDVVLSPSWAAALGRRRLAGQTIGSFLLRATLRPLGSKVPVEASPAVPSTSERGGGAGVIGPVIIVGALPSTGNYGMTGDSSACSIGTTSGNQGDEEVLWISNTNQHPVIAQNMYRLKDGHFEQIGMSWLKHGFCALQGGICGSCIPAGPACFTRLGVGCSDPYSASLNGSQSLLGPRGEINAHTGFFPYPPTRPAFDATIGRRLQVHNADLDLSVNAGALYFAEGHYIAADDALAGNGNNNASYRRILVSFVSGIFRVNLVDSTQRTKAGIRAWQDNDPTVMETDIQVSGEGLFILAAKATDLGDGNWAYEYAVQNISSDRSGGLFSIPLPAGSIVDGVGFHDVDYHSGEPFDGTDWEATVSNGALTWATTSHQVNQNANALRWGTLYNFRFQANSAPGETTATLGLFKPALPPASPSVTASTIGPAVGVVDCNGNEIPDSCDLDCSALGCPPPPSCGGSNDCNTNGVPDECEPDCNNNGVADACDIAGETSNDCQPNGVPDDCEEDCDGDGIPDECDPPEDCDSDGIEDCLDLCPCSSAAGACVCPETGVCCWPTGFCQGDYPREACLAQGGTPDCVDSPCTAGCMLDEIDGDFDRDGDTDFKDCGDFYSCFSGPPDAPGFAQPSIECLARFDFDGDGSVGLSDYKLFQEHYTGP